MGKAFSNLDESHRRGAPGPNFGVRFFTPGADRTKLFYTVVNY